jgi:ribosome-associated protein
MPEAIDPDIIQQLKDLFKVLDDKKAEALRVLDVRGKSSVTDFMILATGTSNPHLRALRDQVDDYFKALGTRPLGFDKDTGTGWVVADGFNIMVHLQTQEMREYYRLDFLWKDAADITEMVETMR